MRTLTQAAVLLVGSLGLPLAAWAQAPEIEISGAGEQLRNNIRAHLQVGNERCDSQQRRLDRLQPAVERSVERAGQALGFYSLSHNVSLSAGDPCWRLEITVEPGDPVLFGDIAVDIRGLESGSDPFEELLEELPVRQGDRLNHAQYERLKSSLSATAVENGYFSARFTRSELAIDLGQNRANVNIVFEPGQQFQFGNISITALDRLSQDFIRRFIPFEEGTPYATDKLVELRENFNDSQYFNEVIVTPQLTRAQNQRIPVNIELSPRKRRAYSTGIGVTTDIGPRVRFAYEDRYINRRGHRFSGDLGVSPVEQELRLNYILPLRDPATESLRFSGGYLAEDNATFVSDTFKLETTYRSTVGNDWLQNLFVSFQQDNSEINEVEERTDLAILGANWSRTRSDDPILPMEGWRLFGQIRGASDSVLSDTTFSQFYSSTKYITELGPGRVLLRLQAATTVVDEVDHLPVSVRFFAGGDQSVRGYEYETLGPLNENGEVIGGKHQLAGSVEYDFNILPSWKMAVFYDLGNAFNDFGDMRLRDSAGLGIRWISPIGPIRVDVARAFDEEGSFRLHITMGPDL